MSKYDKLCLIGRKSYKYNDDITINIPTLHQVHGDNEKEETLFWSDINLFTQTPSDMVSELDSMGIDFEQISDYDLFTLLFLFKKKSNATHTSMLFTDFSLWDLDVKECQDKIVLADENDKEIINEDIYNDISDIISMIIGHKKTPKEKFGNAYAKKKWIERDYRKKERLRNNPIEHSNVLDGIVLRLVCNANFPYNFDTVQDVTIYDLIYSLKQIEKDMQVTDLLQTRLVGNDLSKVPNEQLSRFVL